MKNLRVGSRGSDLALIQTRWVCEHLRAASPSIKIEEVIIATHGDAHSAQSVTDDDWPMGGFTSAIERALLEERIDFAVHSLKDLPVVPTPGTRIAAIPARDAAHDVLITAMHVSLDALPENMRIGTSSPRRAAQIRRLGSVQTVPMRGNVPTRIARVGSDMDGVILAAAGLKRLGITGPNRLELPIKSSGTRDSMLFLPAPGQGALAVQVRGADDEAAMLLATLEHHPTRMATTSERELLARLGGGCTAPIGAYATISGNIIMLRAQAFYEDGAREVNAVSTGNDPINVACDAAARLEHKARH